MIGFAAVAFAACSNHDFETLTQEQIIQEQYKANFVAEFGQPASNHTWGFGRATTRATEKTAYSSDTYGDKVKPSGFTYAAPTSRKPTKPEFATTASAAGALDAATNSLATGGVFFVKNGYTLDNPQNFQNMTIYIDDNMTFNQGLGDDKGNKIIVSEGKTLKVTSIGTFGMGVSVYLAPDAVLDLSEVEYTDWSGTTYNTFLFDDSNYKTAVIYMSAGSKIKDGDLYLKGGYKVLNEGNIIDVDKLTVENDVVLWNEGTVDVDGEFSFVNNNSLVFNASGKKFTVNSLSMKTDGNLLFNQGTFESEGAIAMSDGAPQLVNDTEGILKGASLSMDAGAMLLNAGTATIYGKTTITNNITKWLNEGDYTSGDFEITGYDTTGSSVWNNCKLTVTATGTTGNGQFRLNRGAMILEGGAEQGGMLACDNFYWDDTSGFYLGSKSMVNVKYNIYTDNYNSGYGFHGFGNEYAVVKAASITKSGDNQFSMNYYGNLYVDIPSHFEQGYIDTPNTNQPYYSYEESVKFGPESSSPVYIKPSNCNDGYGTEEKVEYEGRIMAEDLSAKHDPTGKDSDWDFNDVVFDWAIKDGKAYIKLLAAGGQLQIRVGGYRNDNSSLPTGSIEIHSAEALGGYMVNTGVKTGKKYAEFVLDDHEYADGDGNDILITVLKGGSWVEIQAEQGEPAGKFNAPVGTLWCEEYANIKKVYTQFGAWVANETVNWAVDPTPKYVDYEDVEENRKEAAATE